MTLHLSFAERRVGKNKVLFWPLLTGGLGVKCHVQLPDTNLPPFSSTFKGLFFSKTCLHWQIVISRDSLKPVLVVQLVAKINDALYNMRCGFHSLSSLWRGWLILLRFALPKSSRDWNSHWFSVILTCLVAYWDICSMIALHDFGNCLVNSG